MSRKTKTLTRRARSLIIALGVLVLLGGGYYGSTVWKKKKAEALSSSYTPSPKLGNLNSSDLIKIETGGNDGFQSIVLEKKDEDDWELVSLDGGIPAGNYELDQGQIRSLTYSLASVWAERIVDEKPADLSAYGLDKPSSWAVVTDSAGTKVTYFRGDMTPARTQYYVMEEGDPRVYSVSTYSADNMALTLDKIRSKSLFPAFDLQTFTRLRIESPQTSIDISVKPESAPAYLVSPYFSYMISSPYKIARGADNQALNDLLTPLNSLKKEEFIDDLPPSLRVYGLDRPVRIFLEANDASVDLLVGNQIDGKHYAKLAGAPEVFTLNGLEPIINVKPFALVDKFALLVGIDMVDHLSVTGGEKPLSADFQGQGDDGVYFLNGKKAETKSFKTFYQAVIGLMADAEYPGGSPGSGGTPAGEITIEYRLNTPPGQKVSITLVPYNRDFYALRQEGTMEFLISRSQVRRIYETADAVVYEDE